MGQKTITKNTLFYGDNLDIMRQYLADESIDLIYLDPPFNSSRNYNVLYKDESGLESDAQIMAFEDTWHWSKNKTEPEFLALQERGDKLAKLLATLVEVMGRNPMTAYLVMMSSRLVELHRVLKPTGSLYLHCDPTASHYLKIILDMIFGVQNYRNEISWKRTSAHNDSKRFGNIHDVLLYYSKNVKEVVFNPIYIEYDPAYLKTEFREDEQGRWYKVENLTAPWHGGNGGKFEFHGQTPGDSRMWRFNEEKMEELWKQGRIKTDKQGVPLRRGLIELLDEKKGMPIQDFWEDVLRVGNTAKERLGYPTQKPLALLERIINASSNPGDVILDPFCGCGTATHAAQKLGRVWVGIDITYLATTLIKSRLADAFDIHPKKDYDLIGEPTTLTEAQHLATQDRYQFQWWALGLLPARPYGGQGDSKQGKKGSDKGIDGIMTFQDDLDGAPKRIIVQVKSGKVKSGDIRDLHGTIEREKAVMGVFVTLEPPSRNMEIEALELGRWKSANFGRKDYPKIQILTIEQLLNGVKVEYPQLNDRTLAKAQREDTTPGEQRPLL